MPNSIDPTRLRLTNDDGTQGVLLGSVCGDCGVKVFGPATFCQSCTSGNLSQLELSTQGTLFSYTVVRVPPAGWPGPVPYILGEIELAEGPHVLAEVIDVPDGDPPIGMNMELALQQVTTNADSSEPRVVYKWRPAGHNNHPGKAQT